MVESLGYIDKSRVAVWGWSYGGYLTAQILAKEQKYVKCGIAIAPVSQWELYGKFIILTCYRGVFRILILWVLSVNKIFIQQPQFFPTVLKCPRIAGANSLFFKIAGAPIAHVLNTPLTRYKLMAVMTPPDCLICPEKPQPRPV